MDPIATLTPTANSGKWKIDRHQWRCYRCFSSLSGTIGEERVQRRAGGDPVRRCRRLFAADGCGRGKRPSLLFKGDRHIDRTDDAVRCAVVVQQGMEDHNTNLPESERIRFRSGINIGDIIIEADDIYEDGVSENTLETME